MSYLGHKNGRQFHSVVVPVLSNQGSIFFDPDPYASGYYGDTLFGSVSSFRLSLRTPPLPIADYLSIMPSLEERQLVDSAFRTEKPSKDKWDSGRDWRENGNTFWPRDTSPFNKVKSTEQNTVHTSFGGTVLDNYDGVPVFHHGGDYSSFKRQFGGNLYLPRLLRSNTNFGSTGTRSFQLDTVNSQGFLEFNTIPTLFSDYGGEPDFPGVSYDFVEFLEDVESSLASFGYLFYYQSSFGLPARTILYENLSHTHQVFDDHLDLSWSYDFLSYMGNWPSYDGSAGYRVENRLQLAWRPTYGSKLASDVNIIEGKSFTLFFHSDVTEQWSQGSFIGAGIRLPHEVTITGSPMIYDNFPTTSPGPTPFENFRMGGRGYLNYRTDNAKYIMETRFGQIKPSRFYAFGKALDAGIAILSSNNIANAREISEVLKALPDIPKLASIIQRILKGEFLAIKELIDLLTEEILKFNFGTRPTANDANELLNSKVGERLRALAHTESYIGRGSFRYDFLETENPFQDGKCYLLVRCKSRFSIDSSSLVMAILSANALGVLPTLSRLWEIVPFSFVVDWVINMKQRIKDLDTLAFSKVVRSEWNLTSYKLIYEPSSELLDYYGLTSPENDPLQIIVYKRVLSFYTPSLSESIYDFRRAVNTPNLATVGSLVWQLTAAE